jgi:hypothetical protein
MTASALSIPVSIGERTGGSAETSDIRSPDVLDQLYQPIRS